MQQQRQQQQLGDAAVDIKLLAPQWNNPQGLTRLLMQGQANSGPGALFPDVTNYCAVAAAPGNAKQQLSILRQQQQLQSIQLQLQQQLKQMLPRGAVAQGQQGLQQMPGALEVPTPGGQAGALGHHLGLQQQQQLSRGDMSGHESLAGAAGSRSMQMQPGGSYVLTMQVRQASWAYWVALCTSYNLFHHTLKHKRSCKLLHNAETARP